MSSRESGQGERRSIAKRAGAAPEKKAPPLVESAPLLAGIAYRVDEAARRIDIGKSKMWELVWNKRIPARKIDGATVILHEDLVAFVREAPLFERANAAQ